MSDQTGPDGEWPEADIDERLAEVAELFGTDGPPDLDDIAGPVHWPDVAAVDATQEWESLRRWVDQLIGRFAHLDHHVIPLCWWRHNGHVEALAALRDHERVCYAESSPATAAVDWHRAFRDIEARLREWTGILSCGSIHDPRLRPERAGDDDEWARFVDGDVAARNQAALDHALSDE